MLGLVLGLVLASTASAANGDLTQLAGTAGCISDTGTSGACVDGVGLAQASGIAVSPGGANVYATSQTSSAVTVFDRDPTTGALTQKAGSAGCISDTGAEGCVDGVGLSGANSITISDNGAQVYVAAFGGGVAIFDRNLSTGELTQKAGLAGCISDNGAGPCTNGSEIYGPTAVRLSPNGSNAYVTALFSDAIAIFDRNTTTGVLTQKAGTAGCVSNDGNGGACVDGSELGNPRSVAISPNGASAYVAGDTAFAIFDRNTTTGELTQKAGTAGCISNDGSAGACVTGIAMAFPFSVTVSPDNANVYVATFGSNSVSIFDRNLSTGALTQKPGLAGCITDNGAGPCVDGVGLSAASSVTISPDGTSVYATSQGSGALTTFDRDATTGGLTQKPGTAGCISDTGAAGCVDGTGLGGAQAFALAPDGTNAYVAALGAGAVTIFDREASPPPPADTTPPDLTITKKPKKKIKTKKKKAKIQVSFSSEPGATFTCKLDKGSFKPCSSPYKAKVKSGKGKGKKHTILIVASDAAGNDSNPATVTTKVVRKGG
jgi:DNA-binding beta-propeller fold protein YncE